MARLKVKPSDELSEKSGISAKPLTEEQRAGVKLAYFLLYVISVLLIIYVVIFLTNNFDASERVYQTLNLSNIPDSLFSKKVEQIKQMVQAKNEYREFIFKNLQYVLGVLLPVLTSILGYIFGTKAKD